MNDTDELYWIIRRRHSKEHTDHPERTEFVTFDKACELCHPRRLYANQRFVSFWNWIKSLYLVISYSGLLEYHLDQLIILFENRKTDKANIEVIKLIYSLGFEDRFNLGLVYKYTFTVAYLSDTFDINPFGIKSLSTSTMTTISADQLNAILTQVNNSLGTALAGVTLITASALKETNIVKVDFFSGMVDENPNEWIEKFE